MISCLPSTKRLLLRGRLAVQDGKIITLTLLQQLSGSHFHTIISLHLNLSWHFHFILATFSPQAQKEGSETNAENCLYCRLHTFEQASSSPWLIADAPGSCWPRDALATNVDFQSNPATSFWFVKASRGRWDFSNLRWKTMMVWEKVEGKGTSWWWSTWFPHTAMFLVRGKKKKSGKQRAVLSRDSRPRAMKRYIW